uniref:Transposase n=1 Tax=Anisakis simplex TaxID=6269 RepID=A0A0M3JWV5_ANISI
LLLIVEDIHGLLYMIATWMNSIILYSLGQKAFCLIQMEKQL